jgi:hypothetical protein
VLLVVKKIDRPTERLYRSGMNIKRIAAVFLFAWVIAPLLSCQAGAGFEERDVKKPTQNVSEKSRKGNVKHQSHVAMAHPEQTGSCRDAYCRYAARCAWWPGAPGD